MYLKTSSWIISLVCIVFSLGRLLLLQTFSFVALSDALFLIALPLLIIGGFLWVFASGFFDLFQASFKIRKQQTERLKLSEVGRSSFRFWLEPAGILLILSVLSLVLSIIK